jgi:hypothetical protein
MLAAGRTPAGAGTSVQNLQLPLHYWLMSR